MREESAMSRFILGDCVQVMSRFPSRAVDFKALGFEAMWRALTVDNSDGQ